MLKAVFSVIPKNDNITIEVIKEVKTLGCKISINQKDCQIVVDDLSDEEIGKVFKFIQQYYSISNTSIEESAINKYIANKHVDENISSLLRTLNWAMFKKNVSEKELGRLILSLKTSISMKYHGFEKVKFSTGDIVECCYGTNLTGEISGGHTQAIVCNINKNGMPYLVPITKELEECNITSEFYIIFRSKVDVEYYDSNYLGGAIILDKGKYLAPERVIKVVGRVHYNLLAKVFDRIPSTFDFRNNIEQLANYNNTDKNI